MTVIEKQLEKLGLSVNEVRVYLASLELGSATRQQLAAKAVVARPTTYVAVEGLMKRGLMSSYKKGKKEYVQAEKPERLLKILEDEKRRLAERESKLKLLLPGLESIIAISSDKPEVKYYEGLEGLEAMRAVLFESKAKNIYVVGTADNYEKVVPEESVALHNFRLKKSGIVGRQIVLSEKARRPIKAFSPKWEFRVMKNSKASEAGEMAIFGDYLSMIVYLDRPYGCLFRSKELATTARALFNAVWGTLKVRGLPY